jgi:hypothetical protein
MLQAATQDHIERTLGAKQLTKWAACHKGLIYRVYLRICAKHYLLGWFLFSLLVYLPVFFIVNLSINSNLRQRP